tara:strand:- start:5550 stop:8387 length:2838 start_codon:yes stop_codon:yes gene_type:complete
MFKAKDCVIKATGLFTAALAIVLLTGCGADISDETAMPEVDELALEQCEVPLYGIIGTPTDPIIVDGVEIPACLVNKDVGQIANSTDIYGNLNTISVGKNSWHYEPMAMVLDGIYEIGNNKEYATLTELVEDRNNYNITAYAKPGTVIIVHRNARVTGAIYSLDDNNVGGGEWGGVIVNGIGYSADCPQDISADNFCNVKGPFGYYGGVGLDDDLSAYRLDLSNKKLGVPGLYSIGDSGALVAEAGEEVSVTLEGFAGGTINAAVTAYAPLQQQTGALIAYSGSKSLVIYDGSSNDAISTSGGSGAMLMVQQAPGTSVEANDYHGNLSVAVNQNNSESAVLINGGQVTLNNATLLDQFNTSGNAVEISGGASVAIHDVIIQGFDACLQVQDAASSINSITTALFNCATSTVVADSGTDYAASAVASATDFVEGIDPELLPTWLSGNESLSFTGVAAVTALGAGVSYSRGELGQYVVAIQYPQCMGVGTLSNGTLTIDNTSYQVCDLDSAINRNATLYGYFSTQGALLSNGNADYNAKHTAWRIKGQVMVGSDFSALTAGEQTAALASPLKFNLASSSKLIAAADSDAELIVQPNVLLKARGSSETPLAINSETSSNGDITSAWRGMTINGSDAQPEDSAQVNIQYLRLLDTGEDGQAALTLNNIGAGSDIAYLDIYGAGGDGLNITGGAVNFDNLLLANIAGDQIAWSTGYTGTIETAVISPGDDSTGHVLHGINDSTDYDASPRSRPVLSNITAAGFGSDNTAILLEQGSGLLLFNSVFSEFATCLDIDDAETAALLSSDPRGIVFDGVVLDCDSTLAAESEASGYDYGYDVASSSGVYEEEAVLDTGYVVTGAETATSIDLSNYADVIGAAYSYLKGDNYIGAVADNDDDWYANWSDSVVIAPDEECDGIGLLISVSATDISGVVPFEYDSDGDGVITSTEKQ